MPAAKEMLRSLQVNLAEAQGKAKPWQATRTEWAKGTGVVTDEIALERSVGASSPPIVPPSSPLSEEETLPMEDTPGTLSDLSRLACCNSIVMAGLSRTGSAFSARVAELARTCEREQNAPDAADGYTIMQLLQLQKSPHL